MTTLRIAAADNIKGSGLELLKKEFGADAVEVRGKYAPDELLEKIGDLDALLIRSGTTVTRAAVEKAGARLKLIGRAGVGTDNIDKKAATEKGIVVMNTPFGNTTSAAEQALALIFACARNTARADRLMHEGKWEKKDLVGAEVYEKTLGLIGMGRIGSHVAKVMTAAGMKIVANDPFLSADRARQIGVRLVTLDELAALADFITIHTPLTDETRNLVNAAFIAKMKKGARIVNCARGGIIDEAALAEAVKAGHLAGAGLDVFAQEPLADSPLIGVKNILLTPHLGASTEEAEERCGLQMAEQVVAYFRRGEIINAVNLSITHEKSLTAYVELAEKLAKIAATLLRGAPVAVEVNCRGEVFDGKDTGEVSAAAVIGVLEKSGLGGLNIVNALSLAKERGLAVASGAQAAGPVYHNRVDVTLRSAEVTTVVGGTVSGDQIFRLIRLDDADIDMRLGKHLLFLRYPDTPGYVGKFGTLIGEAGVNIEHMEVGALTSRQRASMTIAIDQPATDDLLKKLLGVGGVEKVFYCKL
ncbi:MAG: phosphoglycerate dehydrogenase [Planctomycetota bacterium]|jgi:D-3-phosphoglycerate dehydrogenase|nr:phosphoglycerate dehydrogenase [Planctomycetota bacterium]